MSKLCSEFNDKRANSVDLDEVAHHEPPHQDLHCLQIQLFSSLVLKELRISDTVCLCSTEILVTCSGLKTFHDQDFRCFSMFVQDFNSAVTKYAAYSKHRKRTEQNCVQLGKHIRSHAGDMIFIHI